MNPTDIGSHIKAVAGVRPVDTAAATVSPIAIDRTGYLSALLHVAAGAASGSPTSFTVNAKIQHCDTSGGSYADYTPPSGVAAITAIAADNGEATVAVNLAGAKQFVEVALVVAFVAGTTPKVEVAATLILGGADVEPAA